MNRFFSLGVLLILAACNTQPKNDQAKVEMVNQEIAPAGPCGINQSAACAGCPNAKGIKELIVSVDSVQKNPEKYYDKTIALKGRVIHTCKVSGKKMFLAGSDEENLIRINAGDNISRFDESLQGEIVIARGILTPVQDVVSEKEKEGKTTCVTESKTKQYVLACSDFEVQSKE